MDGEPYLDTPQDLYIPPDALEIFLDQFEGPLDLLLYLIRKQNVDILNINLTHITRQYMQYIEAMQGLRFELAADYLVMAAMLAEIKSRSLLPRRQEAEAEEDDPRAQLLRRLQIYEQFKNAADNMDQLPRLDRDFLVASAETPVFNLHRPLPEVELDDLLAALRTVLHRSSLFEHHQIKPEKLSTRSRMASILDLIQTRRVAGANSFIAFSELFTPEEGRAGVIVSFVAVLELVKSHMIKLTQNEAFGQVYVSAISESASDDA